MSKCSMHGLGKAGSYFTVAYIDMSASPSSTNGLAKNCGLLARYSYNRQELSDGN